MATTDVTLRIHGALNARGQVIEFRQTTKDKIVDILDTTVPESVQRMQEAMYARFTEGSGRAAASLRGEVDVTNEGAAVRLSITNYREVKYLTTLVPDSQFRGTPYPIVAKKQRLQFFWKRIGRVVSPRAVTHPGFGPNDVLRQAAETELSILGYLVQYTVRSAVAEVQSGGRILRTGSRR